MNPNRLALRPNNNIVKRLHVLGDKCQQGVGVGNRLALRPHNNIGKQPKKAKLTCLWMENLNPLRTRFKNLDYIKI